jgi:hypothetical protein
MVVNYHQHPLACPNAAHNPKPITAPSLLLRQAATATPHTRHHHHLHQKLCQSLRNTIRLVLSSSRQGHHQRKLLQGTLDHCSTSSPCHLTAIPSPSPSISLSLPLLHGPRAKRCLPPLFSSPVDPVHMNPKREERVHSTCAAPSVQHSATRLTPPRWPHALATEPKANCCVHPSSVHKRLQNPFPCIEKFQKKSKIN